MTGQPTVEKFLAAYAPAVQLVAFRARTALLKAIPGCSELLDVQARVIGYGYGSGYADTVCVLILSKTGVKLGFPGGGSLPDPRHLLQGAGLRHRYVPLTSPDLVQSPGLRALLRSALSAYEARRRSRS